MYIEDDLSHIAMCKSLDGGDDVELSMVATSDEMSEFLHLLCNESSDFTCALHRVSSERNILEGHYVN